MLLAVVASTSACSGDDDVGPSEAGSVASRLPACSAPVGAEAESECLDEIADYLETNTPASDGGPFRPDVEVALSEVVDIVAAESGTTFGFERRSGAGDFDDEASSTEPLELVWQVGTTTRTMWLCFGNGGISVEDVCDG